MLETAKPGLALVDPNYALVTNSDEHHDNNPGRLPTLLRRALGFFYSLRKVEQLERRRLGSDADRRSHR